MPPTEPSKRPRREHPRLARLLTPVRGLSGTTYPVGTLVSLSGGGGESVDGFVAGDWLPLRWWEFASPAAVPFHDR